MSASMIASTEKTKLNESFFLHLSDHCVGHIGSYLKLWGDTYPVTFHEDSIFELLTGFEYPRNDVLCVGLSLWCQATHSSQSVECGMYWISFCCTANNI